MKLYSGFSRNLYWRYTQVEDKKNPNGVNNETEVVRKAAPPPMKKAKKGETSQAV